MSESEGQRRGPTVDVTVEKRRGRLIGSLSLIGVLMFMVALVLQGRASPPDEASAETGATLANLLGDFDDNTALQALALAAISASFLLAIPAMVFLHNAVRGRLPEGSSPAPLYLGIAGAIGFCLFQLLGFFAFKDVSDQFAEATIQTNDLAEQLADDSRVLQLQVVLLTVARFLFSAWACITSYRLAQVGLLPSWLSLLGIGGGIAFAVAIPAGESLYFAWIGSIGLILLGRWPGGIPEAWSTGRAEDPF